MADKVRLTPEQRKTLIINAAVKVSNDVGLFTWTRKQVAAACTLPTDFETVKHYFPKNDELRKIVAEHDDASAIVKEQARAVGMIS